MAGHSKWSTIKRKKAKIDSERGKIFTKISKEIFVAVKQGGADPEGNFRLKLCLQNAKANNVPADNIKRCIEKAAGVGTTDAYEEFYYEGYGPGGVAILCSMLTDNRNRTASEIRYIFSRNEGNLGETGCVAWMFQRKGEIRIALGDKDEDELLMAALDAGAEDVTVEGGEGDVICPPELLEEVRQALMEGGFEVLEASIAMLPANTVEISDPEQAAAFMKLLEALEDNDDVQDVYANFDIPEEIMAQIEE